MTEDFSLHPCEEKLSILSEIADFAAWLKGDPRNNIGMMNAILFCFFFFFFFFFFSELGFPSSLYKTESVRGSLSSDVSIMVKFYPSGILPVPGRYFIAM
ncbi:hypothetical protein PEX2_074980 [Penicillium expansum]|uniref:Uncharacterized protein n=1 Tax=Penicillium expansum TaxID=27334 RepID=A0A0A2I666_PENEN|nr:hypothetical protein PEX2_074980 [Penicillium expansum]KGO38577.1 hypothetical protein PEXP_082700 [Penicillium expansum]KGO59518.1 hypothetical protein PEX2_074980 [Penicillium expansum]